SLAGRARTAAAGAGPSRAGFRAPAGCGAARAAAVPARRSAGAGAAAAAGDRRSSVGPASEGSGAERAGEGNEKDGDEKSGTLGHWASPKGLLDRRKRLRGEGLSRRKRDTGFQLGALEG